MGDRVSIQFVNGNTEWAKSAILFSHWGGMESVNKAKRHAEYLVRRARNKPHNWSGPLDRLEAPTVMMDFIVNCLGSLGEVDGDYYIVCKEGHGDNSDNGHHIIDMDEVKRKMETLYFEKKDAGNGDKH